jgi:hypothetical protein
MVVLTVYPCAEPFLSSLRDDARTLLFLHRADPSAFKGWTNTITLTNLGRSVELLK